MRTFGLLEKLAHAGQVLCSAKVLVAAHAGRFGAVGLESSALGALDRQVRRMGKKTQGISAYVIRPAHFLNVALPVGLFFQ